jgi:Caspase domain
MNYHRGFDNYRAVLVGVSQYRYDALPSVPAARNSVRAVQEVLCDPGLCGWPPERVTVISDPESVQELGEQVSDLARQTSGLFLLYYVGHGLLDGTGALYLTVAGTNPDKPAYSGLPWSQVASDLRSCSAAVRFAILDCCFSGRAIDVLGSSTGSGRLSDITQVQGVYTLTATTRNRVAHVPPPDQQAEVPTSFTGELCGLVRDGIPVRSAWLTFHDLYPMLGRRMRALELPVPDARSEGNALEHAFTRNAAFPSDPASNQCIVAIIDTRKAALAAVWALLQAVAIGVASAAFSTRTSNQARGPVGGLDDGGRPASTFARAGDTAFSLLRTAASDTALAKMGRERDRALASARDHTADLIRALRQAAELDPGQDRGRFLASAVTFAVELARRLSAADFRDLADAGVRAMASASSDELVKIVIGLDMDVSGRDLSSLSGTEQENLNALHRATWDDATTWPPAWAGSVRQWSSEVRPGVYRIYSSPVRRLAAAGPEIVPAK